MAETIVIEMISGLIALAVAVAGVAHTRNQMKVNTLKGTNSSEYCGGLFRNRAM